MNVVKVAIIFLLANLISISACQANDVFEAKELGFSITKPSNWFFAAKSDRDSALRKLEDDFLKEKIQSAKQSGIIISIMKFDPSKYRGVIPTVHIAVFGPDKFQTNTPVVQFARQMNKDFTAHLKDAAILEEPSIVDLAGREAGHTRVNYALSFEGQTVSLSTEAWFIIHKGSLFQITSVTRQDEQNGTRAEMRQVIDTIKLE